MFVERINREELSKAIKSIDIDVDIYEFLKRNDEGLYIQIDNGCMGPNPEFVITDFEVKSLNSYARITEKFMKKFMKKFLLEKFGEEYKTAYNENLKNKFEEEIIK